MKLPDSRRRERGWRPTEPRTFVALDFETADNHMDSACALALVRVENLQVVERKWTLLRPPRRQFLYTHVHGITWDNVRDQPTFAEAWPEFLPLLEGAEFLAAHNAPFDSKVLKACCERASLEPPGLRFECTVALARRTWGIYPTTLPDVCSRLRLPLVHHQALSDAEACARIVIAACGKA